MGDEKVRMRTKIGYIIIIIVVVMETVHTSEMLVDFNITTRRNMPEGSKLHTRFQEKLKLHITLEASS
jgi:hypothetical protein